MTQPKKLAAAVQRPLRSNGRRQADNPARPGGLWRRAVTAFGILFVVAVVTVGVLGHRLGTAEHRIDSAERRDRALGEDLLAAASGQCRQLNIQRAETNESNLSTWRFLELQVHLTATNRARPLRQRLAYAAQQRQLAAGVMWTPLSDCAAAVDRPLRYQPPAPQHFYLTAHGQIPAEIQRAINPNSPGAPS